MGLLTLFDQPGGANNAGSAGNTLVIAGFLGPTLITEGLGQVVIPGAPTIYPTGYIPFTDIPSFGSALAVGSVNKKYVVYMGWRSWDTNEMSVVPRGTFVAQTADGYEKLSKITQNLHCFDIVTEFDFTINSSIPHPLYGNQTDIRYDPNYNLTNPSGDGVTWVCDAVAFMTAITDNGFYSSIYQDIFGGIAGGSPVNIYIGTVDAPSSTAYNGSYTWNPATGTVVLSNPIASTSVVSIDGVPQGMAPELMIKHLFVDYAGWDQAAMSLQTSNTIIPTYDGARGRTCWQVAQDIAAMTAPRFVRWQIRIDEYGQINFYESATARVPNEILTDDRDLYNIQWTQTAQQLANVVTASAVANSNQPLQGIAYNVRSIEDDGQRAPYQIPSQLLTCARGMNAANGISLVNTFCASELDERSKPKLEIIADVLPNYTRQIGDKVTVLERTLGLSGPYIIKGMEDRMTSGNGAIQTLRLRQANIFANMNMGLPGGVTNALPQTINLNSQNIGGSTGIIQTFSLNGMQAIVSGGTASDTWGNAIIPEVLATEQWAFSFEIDPSQNYDTAIFHFIYFDSPSTMALNDVMAFRLAGLNDGVVIPAAQIASGYTFSATHTSGACTNSAAGEIAYLYDNIIVAGTGLSIPQGWSALTATITNSQAAQLYLGNTTTYGMAYGPQYIGNFGYLLNQKINYGYFVVMAVNAAGVLTFLRIPFIVSL